VGKYRLRGEIQVRQFRVLAVDDEPRILNFLSAKLRASGYDVLTASNGVDAIEKAQAQEPDLIVLDVVMPKMDGFETLKELRTFSAVPVIFLSARGADTDRIKGLGLGADDYLPKPFSPDELVARIDAVRRRVGPSENRKAHERYVSGRLTVDFSKRLVTVDGREVRLTKIEWRLLSEMTQNAGRLMLYEELLTRVWGPEYRDDVQLLRTWISRLRSKIEIDPGRPTIVRTTPKTGYIIDQPAADGPAR
jgi:DNA-binding response OmpR family regulator